MQKYKGIGTSLTFLKIARVLTQKKNTNTYNMKKLILLFITILLISTTWSCRTKKSTTDFKQIETENVSITDNSKIDKKENVHENTNLSESAKWSDKSFFEAWMQIKSDEATFEDKAGDKWTFKNPQINQKASHKADITKTEQTASESNKVAVSEENQQNDVKVDVEKETTTELKTTDERKTKIVWFYWIGGLIIAGLGYGVLKNFNLI